MTAEMELHHAASGNSSDTAVHSLRIRRRNLQPSRLPGTRRKLPANLHLESCKNGALKQLTHTPRDHYVPKCNGAIISFTSPSWDATTDVKIWNMNPATGEENATGPAPEPKGRPDSGTQSCDQSAKLGELRACGNDETLLISRSGKQIGRFQIQTNTCLLDSHGTIGKSAKLQSALSTGPKMANGYLSAKKVSMTAVANGKNDYYLVNLATTKLSTVASAYTAFWLPGRDQIVYVTPQDLAPLPGGNAKHKVWVQHLMFFDPLKGKPTPVTSGLSTNVDPAWCEGAR